MHEQQAFLPYPQKKDMAGPPTILGRLPWIRGSVLIRVGWSSMVGAFLQDLSLFIHVLLLAPSLTLRSQFLQSQDANRWGFFRLVLMQTLMKSSEAFRA